MKVKHLLALITARPDAFELARFQGVRPSEIEAALSVLLQRALVRSSPAGAIIPTEKGLRALERLPLCEVPPRRLFVFTGRRRHGEYNWLSTIAKPLRGASDESGLTSSQLEVLDSLSVRSRVYAWGATETNRKYDRVQVGDLVLGIGPSSGVECAFEVGYLFQSLDFHKTHWEPDDNGVPYIRVCLLVNRARPTKQLPMSEFLAAWGANVTPYGWSPPVNSASMRSAALALAPYFE